MSIWDETPADEAERYLQQLLELWESPIAGAFDATGGVLPIQEMPREIQLAIEQFEVTQNRDGSITTKVRLLSRAKLLDMIGHHVRINAYGTKQAAEAEASLAELMRAKARIHGSE